jgi:YHS domain-containing protein
MTKPNWRELMLLVGLAGMTLALLNHNGLLAQPSPKPPVSAEFRSRLALDGYDAVAYFKTGKPTKGSAEHRLAWNGATWHFSSAGNKAAFEAMPEAYAPQYGGYCAWAVSEGYTAKGDPRIWRIVGGKLYLNYNTSLQTSWQEDIPGRIAKGDKHWPAVLK